MRSAWVPVLLALVAWALAPSPAAEAQTSEQRPGLDSSRDSAFTVSEGSRGRGQRLGRYELAPASGGTEIRLPRQPGITLVMALVGAGLLVCALWLWSLGASAVALPVFAVGLILGVVGTLGSFQQTRWLVTESELVREVSDGRREAWRLDELGGVEIEKRRPTGFELKRPGQRRDFEVRIRHSEGQLIGRFRLARREEAEELAARLESLLHTVPTAEPSSDSAASHSAEEAT